VGVAYLVAPTGKLIAAAVSYAIGSVLAYQALKDCSDPRTYEPTLMPLWVTLAGGAITLAVVVVRSFAKRRLPSNTSLERTREG
jgi:divalent metal cation (Fe/Co/Zn/Cd) transporter